MTTISIDIMPALSALCENKAAAVFSGAEPVAVLQPSKEAVEAFQAAMGKLVAENREIQVALEKAVPLPLEVPVVAAPEAKPVVSAKPQVEITPEIVKQFAEVIAPLVTENREVQVALEKVAPLPLEVATPVVGTVPVVPTPVAETATVRDVAAPESKPVAPEVKPVVAAKPLVEITPEIVRQFAEVIAPLVTENREVQVALEKIAPLPLEVATVRDVSAPVTAERSETAEGRETPTVREVAATVGEAPTVREVVAPEAKPVVVAKPMVEVTPEIMKQFAEVIAPLVAENREVQVALEKVAPLPLEVAVVAAPVAETATVRKEMAPASELPDAGMVMQAAPVMPQPQIDASVRPEVSSVAVDGVAAAVASQRSAPTPSEVLVAAAEAVADTIMVTPGLLTGEGQIRVQLRPDVLDGTEIQINVTGRAIAVDFLPQTADMATLIQRCLPQLEQHLASRIHSFTVVATVGATHRRKA